METINPNIPLMVKTPETPNVFDAFMKAQAVKGQMQQGQMQDQAMQENEIKLRQMKQAMADHQTALEIMGRYKTPEEALPELQKRLGVNAGPLAKSILDTRQQLANSTKTQVETAKAKVDTMNEAINDVRSYPPEQRNQAYKNKTLQLVQAGVITPEMTHQMPPMWDDEVMIGLGNNLKQTLSELELRAKKLTAETSEFDLGQKKTLAPFQAKEASAKATTAEQAAAGTTPITPYQTAQLEAQRGKKTEAEWTALAAQGDPTAKKVLAEMAAQKGREAAATQSATGGAVATDVILSRPASDDPKRNKVDPKTGLTPVAIFQGALNYALKGVIPAMGMGAKGNIIAARMAYQNTGSALADAAGVDLPTLQAEYKANSAALTKLVPLYTLTSAFVDTATHNLDLAIAQSPNVMRTGSPLANRFVQWASGHELTGNKELTRFETYIYTAAREYAKVTSGAAMSAAGLTDSASKEVEKLISAAHTPEAFQAATEAMRNDMANVVGAQQRQIENVSSIIGSFLKVAAGPKGIETSMGAAQAAPAIGQSRVAPAPKRGDKQTYQGSDYVFDGTQWVRQ